MNMILVARKSSVKIISFEDYSSSTKCLLIINKKTRAKEERLLGACNNRRIFKGPCEDRRKPASDSLRHRQQEPLSGHRALILRNIPQQSSKDTSCCNLTTPAGMDGLVGLVPPPGSELGPSDLRCLKLEAPGPSPADSILPRILKIWRCSHSRRRISIFFRLPRDRRSSVSIRPTGYNTSTSVSEYFTSLQHLFESSGRRNSFMFKPPHTYAI